MDSVTIYDMPQRFIPARDVSHVFTLAQTPANAGAWRKFNRTRQHMRVTGCYCSVFNECHTFDSATQRSEEVKACKIDPAADFRPGR